MIKKIVIIEVELAEDKEITMGELISTLARDHDMNEKVILNEVEEDAQD